jgi:hypothetical protein
MNDLRISPSIIKIQISAIIKRYEYLSVPAQESLFFMGESWRYIFLNFFHYVQYFGVVSFGPILFTNSYILYIHENVVFGKE